MEQIAGGAPASSNKTKTQKIKPKNASQSGEELKSLMLLYPAVQLATLVDETPHGDEWLHEIKFDGYRLLGFVSGGAAALRTRNGKDWTARFPTVTEAVGLSRNLSRPVLLTWSTRSCVAPLMISALVPRAA